VNNKLSGENVPLFFPSTFSYLSRDDAPFDGGQEKQDHKEKEEEREKNVLLVVVCVFFFFIHSVIKIRRRCFLHLLFLIIIVGLYNNWNNIEKY
jgi:hypothetical protein